QYLSFGVWCGRMIDVGMDRAAIASECEEAHAISGFSRFWPNADHDERSARPSAIVGGECPRHSTIVPRGALARRLDGGARDSAPGGSRLRRRPLRDEGAI